MRVAGTLLSPFTKRNWPKVWLLLFTLAVGFSHLYLTLGGQLLANPDHAYLPPFQGSSFPLGSDHLGRDVLAYLFLSCRTAWLLVFPPLTVATFLGVTAGTVAALAGNGKFKISVACLLSWACTLAMALLFHPLYQWGFLVQVQGGFSYGPFHAFFFLALLAVFYTLVFLVFTRVFGKARVISLPLDRALQKVIEVWSTFPKLLLLLLLTTFTPFSLFSLMGWICATYWVLPARVARASVLQIKEEAFFESTTALGLPFHRVLANHLWPSLKGPVITNFCFAASGLLGIGSTLAYLGIGLPADVPSWGKMLASARLSMEAWWLFAFPSLLLLVSIFSLQALGSNYSSPKPVITVTKP